MDPLRMYIVVRRGAFDTIDEGGRLAGIAAVRAVREFPGPELDEWRPRPGKVVLRARSPSQWREALEHPHAAAGDGVIALPPRRRGDVLAKLQAMSTTLEPAPEHADAEILYALNPDITMSSGKTLAQIAHAAVMADDLGLDITRARVVTGQEGRCVAEVRDAGLTEIAPGTITVRVLVRQSDA